MPYNEALEKAVLPSAEKIIAAVKEDLLGPNDIHDVILSEAKDH